MEHVVNKLYVKNKGPYQFTLQTVYDLFCKAVRCRLDSERLTGSTNVSFWTEHSTHHAKFRAALRTDGTL